MRLCRLLLVNCIILFFFACASEQKIDRRDAPSGQNVGSGQNPQSSSSVPQINPQKNQNPAEENSDDNLVSGPPDQTKKILALLVMGGYTSCEGGGDSIDALDQAMTSIAKNLKDQIKLQAGEEKRVLMSCYDTDPERIYYSWDHEKKTKETSSIDKWAESIRDFLVQNNSRESIRIGIVGHSYGGWTAMQVTSKLLDFKLDRMKLLGLVTLDPISRVDCTPTGFIAGAISGQSQPGCVRAPTDISAGDLQKIAKAVPWVNYYQTSVNVLHSGPVTGADNKLKSYDGEGLDAHIEFINDENIYSEAVTFLNR